MSTWMKSTPEIPLTLRDGLRVAIKEIEEHFREYEYMTNPATLAALKRLLETEKERQP